MANNLLQHVCKIDANTYETRLTGSKYKLAHKSVTSGSWSVPTVKGQRQREIELLQDVQRRVQGLPPVLASEKVKPGHREKGRGNKVLTRFLAKLSGLRMAQVVQKKGSEHEIIIVDDGGFMWGWRRWAWIVHACLKDVRRNVDFLYENDWYWARKVSLLYLILGNDWLGQHYRNPELKKNLHVDSVKSRDIVQKP